MKSFMHSRRGFPGRAVALAAALAGVGGFSHAQEMTRWQEMKVAAPHQHRPVNLRQTHSDGTAESSNWSGYAVTGASGSVTSVTGSWTIPTATCPSSGAGANAYSSFWVGIDGWNSSSVEQTGTDSDCSNGKPVYYAWYEFYPQGAYYACSTFSSCRVMESLSAGDTVTATVTYSPASEVFSATISVTSLTGTVTSNTATYRSNRAQRSSAEWIAETPCCEGNGSVLPLADFGTVSFTNANATVSPFGASTLGALSFDSPANFWESTMVAESGGAVMAQPSGLSGSTSFSVTWENVGP